MLGSASPVARLLDSAAIPATGSCFSSTADRVHAWNPISQTFEIAWYMDCPTKPNHGHWVEGLGSTISDIQLTPGLGLWYENRHSPFTWTYHAPTVP
jgi:hypothetical protein